MSALLLPGYVHLMFESLRCVCVILGRATISDGDGMDPSNRVYAVRCAWGPTAASYFIRQ
jgi:hypothetical protein